MALRGRSGPALADRVIAAWERGDAVLPVPDRWADDAVAEVLSTARPHLLEAGGEVTPLDDPAPVTDDLAVVVTTSGSTGAPKLVELTHGALRSSALAGLDRIDASPDDRWLLCIPLHHVAGLLILVRSRLLGTDAVIHAGFSVEQVAAEHTATHVSLVPTMLTRLLDAGADVARFDRILLGGAAASPHLLERAADAGARVVVTYGSTETSGGCVYDGRPLTEVDVRLGLDDRIEISGPVLMRGYRARPDLTSQVLRDGWFLTEDIGRWSDDGRLEVLGRADDVIVSGGHNVPAQAIAALLREHPDIADAAVTGRPDAEWGEIAVAHVVPSDPSSPPGIDELRRFVGERTDPHHAPRELRIVDELPRTDLGKLRRDDLDR